MQFLNWVVKYCFQYSTVFITFIIDCHSDYLIICCLCNFGSQRFTKEERVIILKTHYRTGECYAETVRRFRGIFGRNNAPTASTVLRLIKKFEETGSIETIPRDSNPTPWKILSVCVLTSWRLGMASQILWPYSMWLLSMGLCEVQGLREQTTNNSPT